MGIWKARSSIFLIQFLSALKISRQKECKSNVSYRVSLERWNTSTRFKVFEKFTVTRSNPTKLALKNQIISLPQVVGLRLSKAFGFNDYLHQFHFCSVRKQNWICRPASLYIELMAMNIMRHSSNSNCYVKFIVNLHVAQPISTQPPLSHKKLSHFNHFGAQLIFLNLIQIDSIPKC